jgi:hypothetical protein
MMKKQIDLWPAQASVVDDKLTTGFNLEGLGADPVELWYQLPAEWGTALSPNCDPYVIASIFVAMEACADLRVHGSVSPSLIRNLEEFQTAWCSWVPGRYHRIDIYSENESELTSSSNSGAIMTFSGGVDSSFTAFRHRTGKAGRQTKDIQAGLVLRGFDIPIRNRETLGRFQDKAKAMLDSLGMTLIPMTTNLKTIEGESRFTFQSFLNSCLTLLQGGFSTGISGSSSTYRNLLYQWALPYGSNSISDPYLCSNSFPIQIDGAGFNRFEKAQALADWPEAMQNLRVCLGRDGKNRDRNCCRCEKCVRNILSFRASGLGLPACFEKDVSNLDLLKLNFPNPIRIYYFNEVLKQAKAQNVTGSWTSALRVAIAINQVKALARKSRFLRKVNRRLHR